MNKYSVPIQIHPLLILLIFANSCTAQVKTNLSGDSGQQPEAKNSQPKMVRTQGMVSGNVVCELQDKDGNIWFSTGGEGAYRYDGNAFTNFTTIDGLSDNDVSSIIEDKSGNILFGTKKGVCKYDGKSFSEYAAHARLSTIPVSRLLEDRSGNLWLGTMDSGVYRYDGKSLSNFLNNDDQPFNDGRHAQTIMDIFEDKAGNIWFCSWNRGGVWRYDGSKFTNFLPSDDNHLTAGYLTGNLPQDKISDDMIYSVMEDKAGNLWFATRRHGACRYDGKVFKSFREAEGFVSRGVYSIVEDRKGNIWLTTNDAGVWCYDGSSFKNYTTKDGLVHNSVFSALEDRSGHLWFGTRGFGLSRFDGKSFTSFSD